MQPPDYTFDTDRLAALASSAILDTPSEPAFDDIVQLAAYICETPVALVSLVAADRQWFKARQGFKLHETGLNGSVCAHALVEPDMLVITDLTQDERTKDNPLVTGDPHIRFYAGAPFRGASGEVLGSLCVIDGKPRPGGLTGAQADALKSLARQVTSQLELRRAITGLDALAAEQQEAARRRNALLQLGDRLPELTAVDDMTRTAGAIVGHTLQATRAGFGHVQDEGDYIVIEPDWTADGVTSFAGRHRFAGYGHLREALLRGDLLAVTDVCTDPRTSPHAPALLDLGVRSFVNVPLQEHGRTVAVFIVHDDKPHLWPPEVLAFLSNVTDRLKADIARLKAEAEQEVLNSELSHRLKNTFAMIQAIATQTLRGVPDQNPVKTFVQRLHGLSAAHDVLLHQNWSSARIGKIVEAVISILADTARFDISGPEIELDSRAAVSLSLLIHELTTNAVKYGALSQDGGRIVLTWRLDDLGDGTEFKLRWREVDGPPAQPPSQTGFGSKLIRMGLIGTGGADVRYLISGFEAEFKAPLAQMELS